MSGQRFEISHSSSRIYDAQLPQQQAAIHASLANFLANKNPDSLLHDESDLPEGIEPPRGRDVFFFWGEEDWIIFVQKRSPAYYIVGLRKIGQSHE